MGKISITKRESQYFTRDYQDSVIRTLKKGVEQAYSFNEVQYRLINQMANAIAQKKAKANPGKTFLAHSSVLEKFDTVENSIVGWQIIEMGKEEIRTEEKVS